MGAAGVAEGCVFLVPLSPSGYAAGVLARWDNGGRAFGYFFGPRIASKTDVDVTLLRPQAALLTARFGDHGLHTGRWACIGNVVDRSRNLWTVPKFIRQHDHADRVFLVEYDDALNVRSERTIPADSSEAVGLPYDSQFGSGVIEAKLSKLLVTH
jgi:hypothetical protein